LCSLVLVALVGLDLGLLLLVRLVRPEGFSSVCFSLRVVAVVEESTPTTLRRMVALGAPRALRLRLAGLLLLSTPRRLRLVRQAVLARLVPVEAAGPLLTLRPHTAPVALVAFTVAVVVAEALASTRQPTLAWVGPVRLVTAE
jgi:hypothetical protein